MAKSRLKAFKQRLPRFRKLANAGICTKRLLRTGGTAAVTYGQFLTGVSNTMLREQRRAAAHAAAPASGPCGQDIVLALMVADGSARGKADPAFAARSSPIGMWAQAVWHSWLPIRCLDRLARTAVNKLAEAKRPWVRVIGPATAMTASAQRLGWTVDNWCTLTTDVGRRLNLLKDPPVVF